MQCQRLTVRLCAALVIALASPAYGAGEGAAPSAAAPAPTPGAPSPVTSSPVTPSPADTPAPPTPAAVPAPPPAPTSLKLATWGGAYGKAQEQAILVPFKASSGLDVSVDATLEGGHESEALSRTPPPDVVELGALALDEACAAGGLLKLDPSILEPAPDGAPASSDFLPGGLADCGVASFAWSTLFVVDKRAFKDERPRTLDDVFNIWVYPGTRALPKNPKYLLELALLADGVPVADVHPLLETDAGVHRALSRLGKLGTVLWWDKPSEAFAMLADGRAAVALGYSGRAFQEIARGRSYEVIWDHQIYEVSYFAIPASAAAPEAAKRFITFATAPARLAAQAKTWPYGPMRTSAVALADKHTLLGTDLKPFLPTAPENFSGAIRFDAKWWAANEGRLQAAFDTWLSESKPATTSRN